MKDGRQLDERPNEYAQKDEEEAVKDHLAPS